MTDVITMCNTSRYDYQMYQDYRLLPNKTTSLHIGGWLDDICMDSFYNRIKVTLSLTKLIPSGYKIITIPNRESHVVVDIAELMFTVTDDSLDLKTLQ